MYSIKNIHLQLMMLLLQPCLHELEVNDTTSNENSDTPPIARAWSEHYEILHEENNPICGTFMYIFYRFIDCGYNLCLSHMSFRKAKIKAFINFIYINIQIKNNNKK